MGCANSKTVKRSHEPIKPQPKNTGPRPTQPLPKRDPRRWTSSFYLHFDSSSALVVPEVLERGPDLGMEEGRQSFFLLGEAGGCGGGCTLHTLRHGNSIASEKSDSNSEWRKRAIECLSSPLREIFVGGGGLILEGKKDGSVRERLASVDLRWPTKKCLLPSEICTVFNAFLEENSLFESDLPFLVVAAREKTDIEMMSFLSVCAVASGAHRFVSDFGITQTSPFCGRLVASLFSLARLLPPSDIGPQCIARVYELYVGLHTVFGGVGGAHLPAMCLGFALRYPVVLTYAICQKVGGCLPAPALVKAVSVGQHFDFSSVLFKYFFSGRVDGEEVTRVFCPDALVNVRRLAHLCHALSEGSFRPLAAPLIWGAFGEEEKENGNASVVSQRKGRLTSLKHELREACQSLSTAETVALGEVSHLELVAAAAAALHDHVPEALLAVWDCARNDFKSAQRHLTAVVGDLSDMAHSRLCPALLSVAVDRNPLYALYAAVAQELQLDVHATTARVLSGGEPVAHILTLCVTVLDQVDCTAWSLVGRGSYPKEVLPTAAGVGDSQGPDKSSIVVLQAGGSEGSSAFSPCIEPLISGALGQTKAVGVCEAFHVGLSWLGHLFAWTPSGARTLPGLTAVVDSFACGVEHCVVLTDSGSLFEFSEDFQPKRVPLPDDEKCRLVCAGAYHSLAVSADGVDLFAWGRGEGGQLGLPADQLAREFESSGDAVVAAPRRLPLISDAQIVAISAGDVHSLCLDANGAVFAWGWGEFGQLGLGFTGDDFSPGTGGQQSKRLTPARIAVCPLKHVACGGAFSCAVSTAGIIYVWGANESGQCGFPPGKPRDFGSPTKLPHQITQCRSIACGTSHVLAIDMYGSIMGWGADSRGQLGQGEVSKGGRAAVAVTAFPSEYADFEVTCGVFCGGDESFVLRKCRDRNTATPLPTRVDPSRSTSIATPPRSFSGANYSYHPVGR